MLQKVYCISIGDLHTNKVAINFLEHIFLFLHRGKAKQSEGDFKKVILHLQNFSVNRQVVIWQWNAANITAKGKNSQSLVTMSNILGRECHLCMMLILHIYKCNCNTYFKIFFGLLKSYTFLIQYFRCNLLPSKFSWLKKI